MSYSFAKVSPCPPIDGSIRPPGSKSITNRALVCAALASGTSQLIGVLDSDDTAVMIAAWKQLGLQVNHDPQTSELTLEGCGGQLPNKHAKLFIGNSGTSIRFLTAALAACSGEFQLDGVPRMRQRPIGDLIKALRELGADVQSLNSEDHNCPPVIIHSTGLRGGSARVAGNMSSQFLSGLMMAAPMADCDVTLSVVGELVSVPYVEMTMRVMRDFGAHISGTTSALQISTAHRYRGIEYAIEPDASAASYFWGAAAIAGGKARVNGLSRASLQGDVRFCEVLEQMGCEVSYQPDAIEVTGRQLQGVDVDMSDISDTVQTLAAVALFASGSTTIRGVAHNRVKETDRISDLARELKRVGAKVEEFHDGMSITPPNQIQPATIQTYDDHRMAMSLALIGLKADGIVIADPQCTAKTYPRYWEDLELFSGSRIERW
ncbi:MAG: 3-phosphoshikimate 1-carboxyvinyltransferase [Pirellulaceae bacterium]